MNRNSYFNYIDEKLHVLAHRIETRGKLNVLDVHVHSENFYLHLFNLIYGLKLENLNANRQNVEAIDLIDHTHKIIFQVSATCSKQKIESALEKPILNDYSSYAFKFIAISKEAAGVKKQVYKNPYALAFNPQTDIYDIASVLTDITVKKAEEIKKIYNLVKEELGGEINLVKLDSNLSTIINLLSKEQWDDANKCDSVDSFEIERKITRNELNDAKEIIDEYCRFYGKVDQKYAEFDAMGAINYSYAASR